MLNATFIIPKCTTVKTSVSERVLLVDNSPYGRLHLDALEAAGHKVSVTSDPKDAIYAAVHHQPSHICILGHTSDIDTLSLIKLLYGNVITGSYCVTLLSDVISETDLTTEGIGSGHIRLYSDTDDVSWIADLGNTPSHWSTHRLVHPLFVDRDAATSELVAGGLSRLGELATRLEVKRGQKIYRVGDPADMIYYLYSGQVFTVTERGGGRSLVSGVFGVGDHFGSLPILTSTARMQSALATADTILLATSAKDFKEIYASNAALAQMIAIWLARFATETLYEATGMAYSNVRCRTANALLRLHYKSQSRRISIVRSYLAALVGTTTESAVRTLSAFKHEGLIDTNGKKIQLLDIPRLNVLSNG